MKISIIIPTLNEEKYLPILLKSLEEQTYCNFEVIVSDANSTDQTKNIANKFGAKVVEGGLPSIGRNNGAKVATGDFLFFLDSDVKLPSDFLECAVKEIQTRYLDLATCEFVPLSDLRFDKVIHDITNLFIKLNQFTNNPHSGGACIIVSKRLFDRVNGFNESLKLSEDHDFSKRASEYRPLRVLRTTKVLLSTRRLDKEGRLGLIKKYALSEMSVMTSGLLKNTQEYEFAKYDDLNTKKFDKKLIEFERKLDSIEIQYKKILYKNILEDPLERDDSKEEEDLKKIKEEFRKEVYKFFNLFKKNK